MGKFRPAVLGVAVLGTALLAAGCSSNAEDEVVQRNAADTGVPVVAQPDNNGVVILDAITGANVSVDIPIYSIDSPLVTTALEAAKKKGVNIRIMINGGYGSYAPVAKSLLTTLQDASGDGTVAVNWSNNNFNVTHQKSVIVDAVDSDGKPLPAADLPETAKVVISTGNFSSFNAPFYAARDYDITVTDPDNVATIENVFSSDFSCAANTVINPEGIADDGTARLVWSNGTTGVNTGDSPNAYPTRTEGYPGYYDFAKTAKSQSNSRAAYLDVITNAVKGDVLRFTNEELTDEQIVYALADAAEAGVDVRINMSLPKDYTDATAAKYKHELWGVWVIVKAGATAHMFTNNSNNKAALYIHAKIAVKNGDRAFVGSENASTMSLEANRELGISLAGGDTEAISAMTNTFDTDWARTDKWVNVWTPQNVPAPSKDIKAVRPTAPTDPTLLELDSTAGLQYSDLPEMCGSVAAAK